MPKLTSSSLKSTNYDERASTLIIVFRNGGRYLYREVPRTVYEGLLAAPSKGIYFDEHVRDRYRFDRG